MDPGDWGCGSVDTGLIQHAQNSGVQPPYHINLGAVMPIILVLGIIEGL